MKIKYKKKPEIKIIEIEGTSQKTPQIQGRSQKTNN
jgi:hypothetical protein